MIFRELRGAIALAFGHLIGVTCSGNKLRPCKTDTIAKYSRIAYEAFKSAKTHPEMIVTLMALRNTNLIPAIERLIPHAKSGSVPHAVRPHVIFALQPIAAVNRGKFLSAIQPLILNQTETTEIRVAAISSLFRVQPTFLELQQLIAGAIWERNQEVLNFMMTTFRVTYSLDYITNEFDYGNVFYRTTPIPRIRVPSRLPSSCNCCCVASLTSKQISSVPATAFSISRTRNTVSAVVSNSSPFTAKNPALLSSSPDVPITAYPNTATFLSRL